MSEHANELESLVGAMGLEREGLFEMSLAGIECVVRGLELRPLMAAALRRLAGQLSYLARQAEAHWPSSGFGALLCSAHSVRPRRVLPEEKERLREEPLHCVACGSREERCEVTLDLAGPCHAKWCDPSCFSRDWKTFCKSYARDGEPLANGLACTDMGTYPLGKTCTRKAQLSFQARTFLQECAYDIAMLVREEEARSETELDSESLYFSGPEAAAEQMVRFDQIKDAVAKDSPAPELFLDEAWWEHIDEARAEAAERAGADALAVLCDFAAVKLRSVRPQGSHPREEEESSSDSSGGSSDDETDEEEVEEEPDDRILHKRKGEKRRRRQVVEESDPEGDDETQGGTEQHQPTERACRKRGGAPTRRSARVRAREEGAEASSEPATAPAASAQKAQSRAAASEAAEWRSLPSATQAAATQRRPDAVLPARRSALSALTRLLSQLQEDGKDEDASCIAPSVSHLQQLISYVGPSQPLGGATPAPESVTRAGLVRMSHFMGRLIQQSRDEEAAVVSAALLTAQDMLCRAQQMRA
ncbi:MAG: hypothetical protein CMI16_12760 [Opitutaceae bacterium]|nr:hypothetical protein [Opitutaceae bacterium]